jgi:hypothetical protein
MHPTGHGLFRSYDVRLLRSYSHAGRRVRGRSRYVVWMVKEQRPSSDWNYADVKAELAQVGANVHSDAKLLSYGKPEIGQPATFVVLDQVADLPRPPYQIWGFCTCLSCGEYCYVGSESVKLVAAPDNDTYPLCIRCANKYIPRDKVGEPDDHVDDALIE